MKLVSFSTSNKIRPGVLLEDDTVVDLSSSGYTDALAVIASGLTTVPDGSTQRLSNVRLHAPISNPPRVFAIGLNYRDHAKESGMEIPKTPVVFFKLTTAIIGPGEPIVLPKNSTQPDYEAEFAFVIGKFGYRIPASEWREHVYGYTIVNDISARDVQFATSQWSMSKSFPTFCPLGPAIVTAHINSPSASPSTPKSCKIRIPASSSSESLRSLNTFLRSRRCCPAISSLRALPQASGSAARQSVG
jgi:2-keto-4-pentenoate hydratase/2-oxohepta-3-ene-1,7-dioic acid hydratase in catechol pathway